MVFVRYVRDQHGNIAIMTALLLALLIGFAGAGIDFYAASNLRAQMQNATDAAALAGGSPFIKDSERVKIAKSTFDSEFRSGAKLVAKPALSAVVQSSSITVTARGDMRTSLIQILGVKKLDVGASSVASFDFITPEIALVLDVSGSMNAWLGGSSRLVALKAAATSLIDTVDANAKAANRPKYAIIPFNMTVNVGASNAGFVDGTTHPLFTGDT